jgi:hypothetical protein
MLRLQRRFASMKRKEASDEQDQLAHVERPVVQAQSLGELALEGGSLTPTGALEEMREQRQHVLAALAQRRQLHRQPVDAAHQIFFADDPIQGQIEQFLSQLAGSPYWAATTSEYGVGALQTALSTVVTDPFSTNIAGPEVDSWLAGYLLEGGGTLVLPIRLPRTRLSAPRPRNHVMSALSEGRGVDLA